MADPLSELEQEHFDMMLPTARHEFGHYAVARHLGFATFSVSIAAKAAMVGPGGEAEITVSRPLRTIDDVRRYSEDRVRVLAAGVLAEALEDGVIDNKNAILYAQTSGSNDYAKAREHLRILHNMDHPDTTDPDQANKELNAIYDRLWSEATDLVLRYASFIEPMAEELVNKDVRAFEKPSFNESDLATHPLVLATFR